MSKSHPHTKGNGKDYRQWIILIVAIIAVGNGAAELLRALSSPYETDFVLFFRLAGYSVIHNVNTLYCLSCQHHLMRVLYGVGIRQGINPWAFIFAYPPFVALAFAPFALLTPEFGLELYLLFGLSVFIVSSTVLYKRSYRGPIPSFLVLLCTLPAMQVFALGQIDVFLFAVFIWATSLMQSDKLLDSGIILSIVLAKPQLLWILIPSLAVLGLWKVLMGICLGGATLTAISWFLVGWSGLHQWGIALTHIDFGENLLTVSLPGFLVRFHISHLYIDLLSIILVTVGIAIVWKYRTYLRGDFTITLGLVFALTLALTPHMLPYNLLFIVFPLVAISRNRKWSALGLGCALSIAYLIDNFVQPAWSFAELLIVLCVLAEILLTVNLEFHDMKSSLADSN
ncbi:MAG: glycosyltransferase family 87 protein [Candidatus Dormibacteria bacterium]